MRKMLLVPAIALLCLFGAVLAQNAPSTHMMTGAADMKWGPVPPIFEKGAFVTVVAGDIAKPGPFVVRLKMPAGYKIAPHWHPTDENVTVLAGTFALGMGETFDEASMNEMTVGGFALLPAEMRHYAMAKTDAMVQVHGNGPFVLTYVNPADDPSKREAASK
jgi:anti-sigma factor ChrR (cupin superfamily)